MRQTTGGKDTHMADHLGSHEQVDLHACVLSPNLSENISAVLLSNTRVVWLVLFLSVNINKRRRSKRRGGSNA